MMSKNHINMIRRTPPMAMQNRWAFRISIVNSMPNSGGIQRGAVGQQYLATILGW